MGETEPEKQQLTYERKQTLRYGEIAINKPPFINPLYLYHYPLLPLDNFMAKNRNNIRDADAALRIASEFTEPTVVAKHMNPCGIGTGKRFWQPIVRHLRRSSFNFAALLF